MNTRRILVAALCVAPLIGPIQVAAAPPPVLQGSGAVASAGLTRPIYPRHSDEDASRIPAAPFTPNDGLSTKANANGFVEVEIVGRDMDRARLASERVGAQIVQDFAGTVLARVTAKQLADLVATGDVTVREPVSLRPGIEGSVGTDDLGSTPATGRPLEVPTEALDFTQNGAKGSRIGIIDYFDPQLLAFEVTNRIVPYNAASARKCWSRGVPCTFGTTGSKHGNAVAEVIHQAAKESTMFLAEADTLTDYKLAIDWFAANKVVVINHSLTAPFDGPGDGTGPSGAIVDYAVSKGITWVNSAGNGAADPQYTKFAGGYWRGVWADPDNDRWLNFAGADESMSVYCGYLAGLRWSDWGSPATRTDYDLFVSDYNGRTGGSGGRTLLSGQRQTLGAPPLEGNDFTSLCNTNPQHGRVFDTNKDGFVSLWVQRSTTSNASPVGDVLELKAHNGFLEHAISAGSAGGPFADSKNVGAISVGAAPGSTRAWYSAQGPTNDGRIKPDLSAPTCFSTHAYGFTADACQTTGFAGTSASAAMVTGAVAQVRTQFPKASAGQAHLALRHFAQTFFHNPESLPNNQMGWGSVQGLPSENRMRPGATAYRPVLPRRILDTRRAIGTTRTSALPAQSTIDVIVEGHAVALNVTLVRSTGPGYLQVYNEATSYPGAISSLNADRAGQNVANLVIVQPNSVGKVTIFTSGGGHVVVDLLGTFDAPTTDSGAGRYRGVKPFELFNSATCLGAPAGCTRQLLSANATFVLPGAGAKSSDGATSVPRSGVSAVVVALTASAATGVGFATVLPTAARAPYQTSTVNYERGRDAAGLAIIPVDTNGRFRIATSAPSHLRVEVLGWFTNTAAPSTQLGLFEVLAPHRAADSRRPAGSPRPVAGSIQVVKPTTTGVPVAAIGDVVANVSFTKPIGRGSLSVGTPTGTDTYRAVTASYADHTSGSLAIAHAANGAIGLTASVATHRIADVVGFFWGPRPKPSGQPTSLITSDPSAASFESIEALFVSDDGDTVVVGAGSSERTMTVWKRSTNSTNSTALAPDTHLAALSGDGSTAFTGSNAGLFSHDLATGSIERVDMSGTGTGGVGTSPTVSTNGQIVGFYSYDALAPGATQGALHFYIRDRTAGTTTVVPWSRLGGKPGPVSLAADGVHLVSRYGNDASGLLTIARHNRLTGVTTKYGTPVRADGLTSFDISRDGSRLAATDSNGSVNIFSITGTTITHEVIHGGEGLSADLSSDGRFLAWSGSALHDPHAPSGEVVARLVRDIARKTDTNVLVRRDGTRPNAGLEYFYYGPATLSGDGQVAIFVASHDLIPPYGTKYLDIYAYELRGP